MKREDVLSTDEYYGKNNSRWQRRELERKREEKRNKKKKWY
jgi:hypothetical protein